MSTRLVRSSLMIAAVASAFWPPYVLVLYLIWPPRACVAGYRVGLLLYLISFFNDFCQPLYLGFHWTDFHEVSPFGSAILAVHDQSEPRFLIFQGTYSHGNQLSFSKISFFFAVAPKRREIRKWSGKNVEKFVFCRMTPSAMTSGDHECQHCFQFVLLFRVRSAQKSARPIFAVFSPASSPTCVDDCCKIGLLCLKGCCHGNEF